MMTFTIIIYVLVTLWASASALLYGARPTKTLSWILVILILPFLGALIYYLFGVNRRKFKFFTLKHTIKRRLYNQKYNESHEEDFPADCLNEKCAKLARLVKQNASLLPHEGNEVVLLKDGQETFDKIFERLRKAEHFIHMQYYILEEGELMDELYKILKDRVDNGVEVRIIYDSLGSFSFRKDRRERFRDMGAKVFPILPIRFGNLLYTLNYRNHRKIIIIDGHEGFTGGVNISDKYIKPISDLGIWEDYHVYLKGPVVNGLHRIFIKDYHFAHEEEEALLLKEKYLPEIDKFGKRTVQIASSGPDSNQPAIMQQYLMMINLAKKSIHIVNPYFIPGTAILQGLKMAALTGVEIKLLVPKDSDSFLAKYSMYAYFQELLAVGIKIYLRKDFSHSKVIIVDDEIVSIGSGNFDQRSFRHNFEVNAIIYDMEIAKEVSDDFQKISQDIFPLDYETFKARGVRQRIVEGFAKICSPLL
ncbi:cardiolipin synthase [Costertonia aggregata]|uniref:Cardiolipin synthase n=2 Tax=Costertonia aggregata TaxID=343403 RepID=A0A7H9AUY3_9FLAO|nr:cardiolipin synthase [Costertonia aggregata]